MSKSFQIFARLKSQLASRGFGYNVFVMFSGTALGQLSSVLLAPILTRLYSPESFGILGAFTALIGILSVISSLCYEMAIPLTKTQDEASNMLAVCGVSLLFTTSTSALIVFAFSTSGIFGELTPYRYLLPVGFFCIGAYQAMLYYATRQGAFDSVARTKIYQGVIGPFTQIGLSFTGINAWGLIIGFIIGQSSGTSLLFKRLVLNMRDTMQGVSRAGMWAMARRFYRFPLLSSWSSIINSAGTGYLLLIIVPYLYSNEIAGFIFLTDRIVARPLVILSSSILQVYIGEIGRSATLDPLAVKRRFLQLAGYQFVIVSAWLILVNLAAPPLFHIVFGQEWEAAVPYLQILSIAYLPQMVVHALVHTLQIIEKQALSVAWEVGRFLAVCGTFYASHTYGFDAHTAMLLYSVCQAAAQIILFVLMYRSIQSLAKPVREQVT